MNNLSLDLQLLRVFEAMLELRSTTQVAERLAMSQPSVSHGLNRLRDMVGDPLFTRVGNGMRPTPRALELASPVRRILETLEREVFTPATFDPASARRDFTLCMTDIGELHYLPRLLEKAQAAAPGITFRVVPVSHDRLEMALEDGAVDLAVGHFPDLSKDRFYQQQLSTSSFVCVARQGNPHIDGPLTLETYLQAPHVGVSTHIRSLDVLNRTLERKGYAARMHVKLRVAHILTLLHIVRNSDLIATVPTEAAEQLAASGQVCAHALPFDTPQFSLRQHWHERFHQEPANQWLRALIRESFGPLAAAPP